MSSLPFHVPELSRGYAALSPAARRAGLEAAAGAERALAEVLGMEVRVAAEPWPGPAGRGLGTAAVAVTCEALPAGALLEVEARLVARVLERLAGGRPRTPAALSATGVEQGLLELLALAALDGVRSTSLAALSPRLVTAGGAIPAGALALGLELTIGDERGRGCLHVGPEAVASLRDPAELSGRAAGLALAASFRDGTSTLAQAELAALAPGDVLLLDDGPRRGAIVLPGGLTLCGRAEGDLFHLEDIRMTETQAAYPITLAVELGRVTLTLGELARLEPGASLPLGLPRDGAVTLRAGERCVARGELVEIDGALGVRIAELGDRP